MATEQNRITMAITEHPETKELLIEVGVQGLSFRFSYLVPASEIKTYGEQFSKMCTETYREADRKKRGFEIVKA